MMKAKVKDTGEIVEVSPCSEPMSVRLAFYETEQGRKFPMFALEFETEVDWEKRRHEIAKELMMAFACNPHNQCVGATTEMLAKWSVDGADKLIAELRKNERQETGITKQSEKKEVYLGDIIEVDGERYICKKAREDQDCSCCDLCVDDDCKRPYGNCCHDYRLDGLDMIFKKIGGDK